MDPLSSIRFAAAPEMMAQVNNPLQDLYAGKQIPQSELQKLDTAGGLQPLDQAPPKYSFDNVLGDFVNEVSAKQTAANDAVKGLITGQNVPLHQAMISIQEASVSFQLMVEVRNKLLDSYQELMRMQI